VECEDKEVYSVGVLMLRENDTDPTYRRPYHAGRNFHAD